jgi:hypothetical protein
MQVSLKKKNRVEWLLPVALILLSTVPVVAGTARIIELSGGAEITPENARFFASPLPVIIHIVTVTIYSVLGAFQFVPSFRHRHLRWHRAAGLVLIPSGLAAALSGLWMTMFYSWPEGDGPLLYALRLLFGSAMLISIVFGAVALRRRDYRGHGAWMLRGYAIGLGAGTQVLTFAAWVLPFGEPNELISDLLMGVGWVINLTVVEWIIRRQHSRRIRSRRAAPLTMKRFESS